ncbi:hypothetical protein [Roseococcus suduntuyensis]|uniref:Lipoprotein n=1 Tax=Roseococcus suduntuyensis TaxID=455361 RepID=A0A840A9A9_9PROT|nr:hypothetical protein [Roseococcus suduntuyensis]MBB3898638.1 hypothetical protein [Roseococcus suduntuyensis]
MRALGVLAMAALLAGCAEARRPAVPEPAAELSDGRVVTPLSAILDLAVADATAPETARDNRPVEAAHAAARLEWLSGETRAGYRLANLPSSHRFALQRAVDESRAALAISPDATPEQVVQALLAASRALQANDAAAVQQAMTSPVFLRVRPDALARLRQPGPRPGAALALPALREELERQQGFAGRGLGGPVGAEPVGVLNWMGLAGPPL